MQATTYKQLSANIQYIHNALEVFTILGMLFFYQPVVFVIFNINGEFGEIFVAIFAHFLVQLETTSLFVQV
jgi:hypothetical protein